MLNQSFTKPEIHQLARGLFKDIPFQTESGKNKMKAALHLYRSGNVYNIERDGEDLRATMLSNRTKVHIFLNMKTGFYGTQIEDTLDTSPYEDEVYIAAALLGLFASVDSVGAFLDLWKAHHLEEQINNPVRIPTAIGNDYFTNWLADFQSQFDIQCQHAFESKEKLLIGYNRFILSTIEKERKAGFMRGLSFSYIPLYIFYHLNTYNHEYVIDPMHDTFARRLLELAKKELKKLPKDIFIKHQNTNIEVAAYQDLLNHIISCIGLAPIAHLYGEFFSFDFTTPIHQKQLTWWKERHQLEGHDLTTFFHLTLINEDEKLSFKEIAYKSYEIHIFHAFTQQLFSTFLRKEQFTKLEMLLPDITSIAFKIKDKSILEQLIKTYRALAKYEDWITKCQAALTQLLPMSLKDLADICWEQEDYKEWISLLLIAPKEDMQLHEPNIQFLYEKNSLLLLPLFHRLAQAYIEEKKKDSYYVATFYIHKIKQLYAKNKLPYEWQTYLEILQEKYKNLRSFQSLLAKDIRR